MTERRKRGLSLLALTLAIGITTVSQQAQARQADAPAKAGKKSGKEARALQAFQTGLLVRLAIGVNSIVKVGDNIELYPKIRKPLANANRACARVLNSDATPEIKKKQLLAVHQRVLREIKALLPPETWKKVVAVGDAPKSGELLQKIKVLGLGVGDDPFGFIGETEKNLLRSASLGGDRLIADVWW